jgi:hypothetical protein
MQVYIVQARGWGDREDQIYNIACFSTIEQAHAFINEIHVDWAGHEVDLHVDQMTMDA